MSDIKEKQPACWSWQAEAFQGNSDPWEFLKGWHQERCAVCGRDGAKLVLDHCHKTDSVRGYLCASCNSCEGKPAYLSACEFVKYRERPPTTILGLELLYCDSPVPSGSAVQRAKGLKPVLVWVTPEQHATLRDAADKSGVRSVTGFMLAAALEKAANSSQAPLAKSAVDSPLPSPP